MHIDTTAPSSSSSAVVAAAAMTITLHWTGGKQKLEITDAQGGLDELKTRIAQITKIPTQQQRLVSNGRVIAGEGTIRDAINDGALVTVAKAPPKAPDPDSSTQAAVLSQPPPPPNALGIPPEMMPIMQPMLDQMAQNPDLLSHLMQADPRMKRLMESNPELRQMMASPSFLRQMGETLRNPAAMQEMMRSTDRQLANIENIPGGFQALSSLYSQMGRDEERETNPSTDAVNAQFAERLGATDRSQPLPNPWAPRTITSSSAGPGVANAFGVDPNAALSPFMDMANPFATLSMNNSVNGSSNSTVPPLPAPYSNPNNMFGQLFQALGGAHSSNMNPLANPFWAWPPANNSSNPDTAQAPPINPYLGLFLPPHAPVTTPGLNVSSNTPTSCSSTTSIEEVRTRYQSELETLTSMGFTNEEVNIRALRISGGNVQSAIEFLLGQ
ncbi:hypothetical protein SeMB42_g05129 [Synchytrium endobioticum]|uniref:UBA domain-containing protein n=1 Tax=Synchytrium endobioticum TaxID=286115 RepID=A0A507CTE4_9FUNG|nr:hypothetical protein SeMB42_g05129 [Synchytrium endobioticum]TPX45994.1 hypothetical protein SeLEV6574_g03494 [Synchytrium endobioticum]